MIGVQRRISKNGVQKTRQGLNSQRVQQKVLQSLKTASEKAINLNQVDKQMILDRCANKSIKSQLESVFASDCETQVFLNTFIDEAQSLFSVFISSLDALRKFIIKNPAALVIILAAMYMPKAGGQACVPIQMQPKTDIEFGNTCSAVTGGVVSSDGRIHTPVCSHDVSVLQFPPKFEACITNAQVSGLKSQYGVASPLYVKAVHNESAQPLFEYTFQNYNDKMYFHHLHNGNVWESIPIDLKENTPVDLCIVNKRDALEVKVNGSVVYSSSLPYDAKDLCVVGSKNGKSFIPTGSDPNQEIHISTDGWCVKSMPEPQPVPDVDSAALNRKVIGVLAGTVAAIVLGCVTLCVVKKSRARAQIKPAESSSASSSSSPAHRHKKNRRIDRARSESKLELKAVVPDGAEVKKS